MPIEGPGGYRPIASIGGHTAFTAERCPQYVRMPVTPQVTTLQHSPEIDQRYLAGRNLMIGLFSQQIQLTELPIPQFAAMLRRDELAAGTSLSSQCSKGMYLAEEFVPAEALPARTSELAERIKSNLLVILAPAGHRDADTFEYVCGLMLTARFPTLISNGINYLAECYTDTASRQRVLGTIQQVLDRTDLVLPDEIRYGEIVRQARRIEG